MRLKFLSVSVEKHHANQAVEALVFDYYHFYGSRDWIAVSPAWYRRECRLIRNTIRSYVPDGQYWLVTSQHKRPRNPQAALANAHIFHYGWIRRVEDMSKKLSQVSKYWGTSAATITYSQFDAWALKPFTGTHPKEVQHWLQTSAETELHIDPNYQPTSREKSTI